jgi:hypothetical protein
MFRRCMIKSDKRERRIRLKTKSIMCDASSSGLSLQLLGIPVVLACKSVPRSSRLHGPDSMSDVMD